jgi:hypothetical protein
MTSIPPDQLVVEIDHPDGHTWTVEPLDDAQFEPTINGKPQLRVPVARSSERWLASDWEGVEPDMRAWDGGQRLPIDEFRNVETSPERLVLVGEGGKQLDDPVSVSVNQEEAYLTARNAVQNNTSYQTRFDDPGAETREERLFQDVSGEAELVNSLATPIADTDAFEAANGGLKPLQTCWTVEAENADRDSTSTDTGSEFSNGEAINFISGQSDYAEWDFTPQYDIPAGELRIAQRNQNAGSGAPTIKWSVNGTEVGQTNHLLQMSWVVINADEIGTLPAGETVTIRAEELGDLSDTRQIDVVAPFDNRFSYTLDNSPTNGYLDGPQWFPDGPQFDFVDSSTVFSVVGARVASTWTGTEDDQQLAVSNDLGLSYLTANNTTTLDRSFAAGSAGATLRLRVTLGRQGTRDSATPRTGYQPQRLDAYELYADVKDSPVLRNRRYDTSLENVLNSIADYSNSIWEVVWDESAGSLLVDWTRPGSRPGGDVSDAVDYSLSKNLRTFGKVTVRGSYQQRREEITANHGTAVDLGKDNLVTSRELVTDPSNGTVFEQAEDYEIDYDAGTVTTLSKGSITDGQTIAVDYQFEPRALYAEDGFDPSTDRELPPQKINSVTTDREAEQAALTIQQDLDSPLYEAEVTLSTFDAGTSLIDDLHVAELPVDLGFEIQEQQRSAGKVVLQLGSRRELTEIISDIERRLAATQERS